MHIEIAGESVQLLSQRALWWPAQRTLWIADLHLGKAATYRSLGQPVPSGTTQENLQRLSHLVDQYQAEKIVFLGDFLHAAQARTPDIFNAIGLWRKRHSGVSCLLVRGNHDSRSGDPPPQMAIDVVDEPYLIGPFAACHHPQQHATHFVLAGHVHPVVVLQGTGRDRLRLPCFSVQPRAMVLPAFGEFTGGYEVSNNSIDRLYAIGADKVWPVPCA
jgi:uncharacterized protein